METRKVQKVGGGTYTVSLPKEWARARGVTTGTEVELHTHVDGTLVVQAGEGEGGTDGTSSVTLTREDPSHLERVVRAGYAAGASELCLEAPGGFSGEQKRAMRALERSLAGVTVDGVSDGSATVRALVDPEEVSVRQSVRQLRFVALSMHRDATAALTGEGAMASPGDRDDQADRLYALVERHFVRGLSRLGEVDALGLTRGDLFELWTAARELERVADHAERIAGLTEGLDPEPAAARDVAALAADARAVVEDAVSVVIDGPDLAAASEVLAARDGVRAETEALDRRLFEASGLDYRLARVLDSVARTAEHGGTIAESALRTAVRDPASESLPVEAE